MADKQKEDNDALYKRIINERTEKIENLKSTYKVLSKKIPAIEQASDSNMKSGQNNNSSVDSKATMAFSLLGGLIDECIFDVLLGVHKDLRTRTSVCQICQSTCQGYVNETGCDIFGNSYTSNNLPSYECVNCHKMYPATRYAPHLEKCLGLAGRQSTRVANRRMGSQSPFTALNLSEDSMGGSDIESSSFEKKRRRALGKISNDLSRLKKIRAQGSSSQGDHKASYADHIRAELEDSDTSESNYRSNGRRSASPGSYAGDVKRSSSVPIKDVPKSPTSDDSLSKSDRRATAKAGRSKSKLAIYSSDEEEFDSKADFIDVDGTQPQRK